MAAALCLAVYFLAIADGMYGRLLHDVLRMQAGNLTVENAQHLDAPSIDLMLDSVPDLRDRIEQVPGVSTTKELIVGQGVANSAEGAVGTVIVGVQPSVEASMSPLVKRLVTGSYLQDGDERAVVLGAKMASRLGLAVGNKLVLSTNDTGGQMVQQMVRVKGIFETGSVELDGHFVQVPIRFARVLFSMRADQATQVGILLHDPNEQESVMRRVQRLLADHETVTVWPWQKILPELSTFMQVDKGSNYVFQLIILMMAMFTIFNTIVMSALERKREFAVMLALGTSTARVKLQLFVESILLGTVGCAVGVLAGSALVDPMLRAKLTARITVGLGAAMVGLIGVMSLVPMSRIKHIHVTDAFR
jgi:ABC-type lipoprotein release transport system permease subunit